MKKQRRIYSNSLGIEFPFPERFLNPSFRPIFFQGFSGRFLGEYVEGSLDGGVIGGVMGSPALTMDFKLPESSVRVPDVVSALVLDGSERPVFPSVVAIAEMAKLERPKELVPGRSGVED